MATTMTTTMATTMTTTMATTPTRDWNALPEDPLIDILERLHSYDQFIAMAIVSRRWRTALHKSTFRSTTLQQPPFLLLSSSSSSADDETTSLLLYSLVHRRVIHRVPGDDNLTASRLSSHGWLLLVGQGFESISLINPFSRRRIRLPDPKSLAHVKVMFDGKLGVCGFVMSGDPLLRRDYMVAIGYGDGIRTAFGVWKSGDDFWYDSGCRPMKDGVLRDLVFYRCGLLDFQTVGVFVLPMLAAWRLDPVGRKMEGSVVWNMIPGFPFTRGDKYMVEMDGKVLVICKVLRAEEMDLASVGGDERGMADKEIEVEKSDGTNEADSEDTVGFIVSEIDVFGEERVKRVKSLGNRSVFLGQSRSLVVDADRCGCKANSVYFIEDSRGFSHDAEGGQYFCVFDLETNIIERHFTGIPRNGCSLPAWFEDTLV